MKEKRCKNSKANVNIEAGSEISPDVRSSSNRSGSVGGGGCKATKK